MIPSYEIRATVINKYHRRKYTRLTYKDPLEEELTRNSPTSNLATYYQQWRQRVESAITITGQVAYLFDYDFHPIMQLPPIIEAEITDRINEVSEISIKMAVLSSTGQLNPIVDILAGNFGVQNAETLELETESDQPYFVGIHRQGYDRFYKIEFCTLEGVHQPETLTITATDLLGFLQRLPCPSVPLEWIRWPISNNESFLLEPDKKEATRLLKFVRTANKDRDENNVAGTSGGIYINNYHQTRIGDRHYRYGEPATIISEIINSSIQAAFHTPPFIIPWDHTPLEAKPDNSGNGIWDNGRKVPGVATLLCSPIYGVNEEARSIREQTLINHSCFDFFTPCYALYPPIRVKQPATMKNDLLSLAQPQDGYILDEMSKIITASGLQISATMWFPGDPKPALLPFSVSRAAWGLNRIETEPAELKYPTIIISLDYISL